MDGQQTQHDIDTKMAISSTIEKFGCYVALFEPDNYLPGFAYSIGLYKNYQHPEIICFGLNINMMARMLNQVRAIVA